MTRIFLALFLFYGTIGHSQNVALKPRQNDGKIIWAGSMLDVTKGSIITDVFVVVENGTIIKIDSASQKNRYKGEDIIDLSDYTILPGLIDCHTHLTNPYFDGTIDVYELPIASYGILGTVYAKQTLLAGFTTVRDVGGYLYSDVALRDAINNDWVAGPRMYVSGKAITMTGGHGAWGNWMAPHLELEPNPGNPVDGEVEVRKLARTLIKNRVDLLKINATGGFGTANSIPGAASFTIDEMKAAVNEARKRGIRIAAHAHGADGIKNAVRAGVNSIEHGTFLDQESIDLMIENEVYLVMDLLAAHVSLLENKDDISKKAIDKGNQKVYDDYAINFNEAYQKGVKMTFGTDASIFEHGRNAEQFYLMVKAGMNEVDAIRSATTVAAELIGIEKTTGSIEEGKWADIIAVKGNPLNDITVLEKVDFVMKDGKVYKTPKK
ncbi:amidohydrolase family protein [Flagellimonas sp. 2504JD1-5]